MIRELLARGGAQQVDKVKYKEQRGVIDLCAKTKNGAIGDSKDAYKYSQSQECTDLAKSATTDDAKGPTSTAFSEQQRDKIELAWYYKEGSEIYIYVILEESFTSTGSNGQQNIDAYITTYKFKGNLEDLESTLQSAGQVHVDEVVQDQKTSTAGQLRSAISTWYKTLRVIALVGLLSVLVYVGIRIILSSTGQEKAKYKNMVTDWLVAICLLFVLHYIMSFTMQITDSILGIFSENTSIVGDSSQDVLMSSVRKDLGEINDNTKFVDLFSEIIIYIVLVIYTVMFVLQYLKRVVWLAFLTMIAPLITLTYPIDKIKDGKAQAFAMWIREYVFNALLPVIHIVLYYMLVGSAMNFITTGGNWLYAIVAVGFLMQAEKFFRKMFGFDQASSAGALGAAAGGALVMNAINKMGQKSGKQAAGKSGGGDSGSSSGGATPRYISSPGGNNAGGRGVPTGNAVGAAGSGFNAPTKAATAKGPGNIQGAWNRAISGGKTLAGHYFNRGNVRKIAKGAGRMARKGIIGAAGAATLGTVGLAAGVASGDLGKALQYGAVGAGAGFMGANALGDKATEFGSKNAEILKEGALGTDEYNTRKSVKELTNDNDFNKMCKQVGVTNQRDREALIRQFHSNGITSSEDIRKAISAGASTGNTNRHELIVAAQINQQAKRYGHKKKEIEQTLMTQLGTNNPNDPNLKRAMSLIDLL